MISLWYIRDLQNEAQSGIKGPNGKQLILLEEGGRRLATQWYWTEREISHLSRSYNQTPAGKGVRAKGGARD